VIGLFFKLSTTLTLQRFPSISQFRYTIPFLLMSLDTTVVYKYYHVMIHDAFRHAPGFLKEQIKQHWLSPSLWPIDPQLLVYDYIVWRTLILLAPPDIKLYLMNCLYQSVSCLQVPPVYTDMLSISRGNRLEQISVFG
jgi:hypothetical protein